MLTYTLILSCTKLFLIEFHLFLRHTNGNFIVPKYWLLIKCVLSAKKCIKNFKIQDNVTNNT